MNPESIKRPSHVLDSSFYRGVRVQGKSSLRYGTVKSDTYAHATLVDVVWDNEGGFISPTHRDYLRVVRVAEKLPETDKDVLRRLKDQAVADLNKAQQKLNDAQEALLNAQERVDAVTVLLNTTN